MIAAEADPAVVADDLRAWARGLYPLEAAVELLIRFNGPCGSPLLTGPWIAHDASRDRFWFNADTALAGAGQLSGGERRTLTIAASLAEPDVSVDLFDALPGLDREHLALVLAAVAHAGGSHEHSVIVPDPEGSWQSADDVRLASRRLGPLYDWPALTPRSQDGVSDDARGEIR